MGQARSERCRGRDAGKDIACMLSGAFGNASIEMNFSVESHRASENPKQVQFWGEKSPREFLNFIRKGKYIFNVYN